MLSESDMLNFAYSTCEVHDIAKPTAVIYNKRLLAVFGRCNYNKDGSRFIEISHRFAEINIDKIVKAVIKHEIAHIDTTGHGDDFKRACNGMGISYHTQRDYPDLKIPTIGGRVHVYKCPKCNAEILRRRKLKVIRSACASCCRKHNNGRFAAKFIFEYSGVEER